jgi:fibro-slime domain-containing protein
MDPWPSACSSSPVTANTGEYCQGLPYAPSTQGGTIQSASGCGTTLWAVARDFIGYNQTATTPPGSPHADFGSHYCCGNPAGTVLPTLGADDKPVYNPANIPGDYNVGVGLTGPDAFNQWYHDAPGVNLAYLVGFRLAPSGDGITSVFTSKLYFPVDNVGFGNFNDYGEDGKSHNFGFTTELHTKFKYQGGEVFSFEGDDDLWVYINKKLAIDLGGIHVAMQGNITLDTFASDAGLVIGQIYALDLFNAERHPSGSNFKITTSMTFVDCGVDPMTVR